MVFGIVKLKPEPSKQSYKVTVETNNGYLTGGTLGRVYLRIVGENQNNPKTEWVWLHHWFKIREFARGKISVFEISCDDVGKPLILQIRLRGLFGNDSWACSRITVEYKKEQFVFPFEDWITDQVSIARGQAFASGQVPHMAVAEMRFFESDYNKIRFQWVERAGKREETDWGLPRYIHTSSFLKMPSVFRWTTKRLVNIVEKSLRNVIDYELDDFEGRITDLDSYASLYKNMQDNTNPPYYECWQTDEEFGRQQLLGISPLSMHKCTKIPDNCEITADDVKPFLQFSLETEMKNGKIYLADYSTVFQGIKRTKNKKGEPLYCPDAFCLYYVNENGDLVPVAIQLVPGDRKTIFTPGDHKYEWLLAKMYFRVAFGNLHEWHYHFLLTHNVMETFAVALFRCFPRSHPIYKLLRPHLQTITVVNTLARMTLIGEDDLVSYAIAISASELSISQFKKFTFEDLDVPELIKKQGLGDAKLLPKFYYRDDVLNLWRLTEDYIRGVIENYYDSDESVLTDYDLQRFVVEMAYEGYGWQDGNRRGIPVPIRTRTELTKLCTIIACTTSIQHAAVNFSQKETYKFIPNSPMAMRLPPPKKGEVHMVRIMQSLPDLEMSITAIQIANSLSSFSPNEVYLGEFPMQLFTEGEVLKLQGKYQNALKQYAKIIEERNAKLEKPYQRYWYLHPGKVPNTIAI